MVGKKINYDVLCPHCGNHIVHHSVGDMDICRYNKDEVVEHKCECCKRKFLVSLEDNHTISDYKRAALSPILF